MVCVFTLALTSCGSGITEEQHNEVLAERDALQAELRELQESRPTAEQYDEVLAERDALQAELQELQESRPTAKQYEGVCVQRDALQAELQELQESRITVQQYNEVCGERDALQAELQRMREEQQPEQPDTMLVNITGSFTATVRHLIPDYVGDGKPRIAIVTLFMGTPFAIPVGEEMAEQLEEGKIYTFEIVTMKNIEITVEEYGKGYDQGRIFADEAFFQYNLEISSFREAEESEYEPEHNFLMYEV